MKTIKVSTFLEKARRYYTKMPSCDTIREALWASLEYELMLGPSNSKYLLELIRDKIPEVDPSSSKGHKYTCMDELDPDNTKIRCQFFDELIEKYEGSEEIIVID